MIKVEVEVNEAAYTFSKGMAKFMVAMQKEVKDNGGWSAGDDLPGIVSSAVTDLLPNMVNILTMKEEYEKDKKAFVQAVVLGMAEMVEAFGEEEEGKGKGKV